MRSTSELLLSAFMLAHMATTLAHWPGQPPHQFAHLGEFALERGGVIHDLKISYVTHGKLNAVKDNAILYMHGFGNNHHHFDHFIGPGRPLDTDRYFVICPDALGATQTTFEHSTSATNSGLKMKFPSYSGRDAVRANHKLVTEVLGIPRVFVVTGFARGGTMAMQMAVLYPDFMDGLLSVSGSAYWGTTALMRFPILLSLIESCDGWQGGNYDENPVRCMSSLTSFLIPNMYTPEWWALHVDTPEAYTKWRNTTGEYWLDIQDARDLYYLIKSGGLAIGDTPGFGGDLDAALRSIKAKTLFIGNPRDEVQVPEQVERQARVMPNARVVLIDSVAGHQLCCNADPQGTRRVADAIRAFLRELDAERGARR